MLTLTIRTTAILIFALLACGSDPREGGPPAEPVLMPATDENPDPNVVEISLEARESRKRYATGLDTAVWTYNGSIPGPLIEGRVGDNLIVHFNNELPEETTIHWHGIRLPAAMDGTVAMQSPVPPGGTFEYEFELQDAGLFWFHPHVRSDVQVEKGLYGLIQVVGTEEPLVDEQRILVLDDVRVLADGSLPTYLDDESKMLGRQGNILLINGEAMPTFRWQAGALQRLQIVNVANGRFFNLSLPGHTWRVIGTDGGFIPKPYDSARLLVSPGERYDVALIATGEPGEEVTLMNEPYERGHDTGAAPPMPLARFVVNEAPSLTGRTLPTAFPELERLPDRSTDHEVVLDEGILGGALVFTINGETYPNIPVITVPAREVRRFEVRNVSEMDHPFHVHGTFFQVLSTNGTATPLDALANKDTVIVPQMGSVELVSRFDEPGRWMYHCHVFEHAEGGMMGEIDVGE